MYIYYDVYTILTTSFKTAHCFSKLDMMQYKDLKILYVKNPLFTTPIQYYYCSSITIAVVLLLHQMQNLKAAFLSLVSGELVPRTYISYASKPGKQSFALVDGWMYLLQGTDFACRVFFFNDPAILSCWWMEISIEESVWLAAIHFPFQH